ncbi:protein stabilized1 [Tanacetum coccineum]
MGLAELEEQLGILITVMEQQKFNLENQGNNRNLRNSCCNSLFGDDLRGNDSHTKGQFKNDTDAYKVIDEMSMNGFIKKYGTVQEYFDSFSSSFSKTRSKESKEGVKNNVRLRDLDVSWKDGVECEEIELKVREMDGSNTYVGVLDESCEENVEDSSEIHFNIDCLIVLDNFECDQSREREFTSFSLSQPSNDTPKISNHSLEENGNPDVKREYDFWDSTLVKMEKVSEETKTSIATSQEVGVENIGVKNYEEGGKENANVKGKEIECVDLILLDESHKEDVKCKKNEYFGLTGFNEFVCEDDEVEEGIDLGRLVYGVGGMKVNASESVDSESVNSEFMVMKVDEFQDCVHGVEMDYVFEGNIGCLADGHERNFCGNVMSNCLPDTNWKNVRKGKCNTLVENKDEYGGEQDGSQEDNDQIVGGYKSSNVFAYDSNVHNPSTKVVTWEDDMCITEMKKENSEKGSEILKFDICGTKCKLKYGKWDFDIWKWPKRKKKRFVIVGGGYAARNFVKNKMTDGKLCIVFKEAFAPYVVDDDSSLAKAQRVVVVGDVYSGMEVSVADVAWNLDATVIFRRYSSSEGTSIDGLVCGDNANIVAVWRKEKVATMEHEDGIKSEVLRKGLCHIPDSLRLWEAVVELANEEDENLLLQRAVECCPLHAEVWLALARLEKYDVAKQVLNMAREILPKEYEIWIVEAKLEEVKRNMCMAGEIMERGIRNLQKEVVELD